MNMNLVLILLVTYKVINSLAGTPCIDITSNTFVLEYCKNLSKCMIEDIGGSGINNKITCECLVGYSLPDCSLQIPETENSDDNETRNTCWLQDLLQIDQENNDFSKYKHIYS
ncbi:hypothetical protein HWI79_3020 [Cryptosporidium felis]|nr:hypothetical protein HWI79_3020 [Cryptosporidium felis]